MKMLFLLCLASASCAHTTFYLQGKKVAHFQGNMESVFLSISPNRIEWMAAEVDHAGATKAGGSAAAKIIQSTATLANSVGAAVTMTGVKP